MGRVQLKYYDERCAEINRAVKYFEKQIKDLPGLKLVHVDESDGSTMAGWYVPTVLYDPEQFEGLSITRFCEALSAEGIQTRPGINRALHTHPIHNTADVYHDGKPTRVAFSGQDIRQMDEDLPVSAGINARAMFIPWFKHYWPEIIDQYANGFKKVVANYRELLAQDQGNIGPLGGWHRYEHSKK